jgi:hypothetical protein
LNIILSIRSFEKLNDCWNERIFVDEFDPSKFTLIWKTDGTLHIQSFQLLDGTIKLGNTAQYSEIGFCIDHYFNECLYECFYVS